MACKPGEFPKPYLPMNHERRIPAVTKWPFYVADLILIGLAVWIVKDYPHPLPFWPVTLVVGCVASAAVLCVWPYRAEYQTAVQSAESAGLTDTVKEIRNIQVIAEQIRLATGQWQGVQEHSAKTLAVSKEVSERIGAEAQAFAEFMQKANDSEKATLRLEVEKLRRGEGQWLQVMVHLLDHVFALHQAGVRSGQPNLEAQLGRFQEACRDVVRRVGLTPFEALPDEVFDAGKHELPAGHLQPPSDARIAGTLAAGYTFQGQPLRRAIVSLRQPSVEQADVAESAQAEPSVLDTSATGEEPHQRAPITTPTGGESFAESSLSDDPSFRLETESLTTGGDQTPGTLKA